MSAALRVFPLGFPWQTQDPFLFCVHHNDAYPRGNADMTPAASLEGREIGMDFEGKDGWRMYHGDTVPGFPQHPHRGFETVTVVRSGLIDHSDSLGATARFGRGDAQWLTAGRGIVHSEMFPLLNTDGPNPAELFQIWLNLPAKSKMAEPHFAMLWDRSIPVHTLTDAAGKQVVLTTIAGAFEGRAPPPPPPASWASDPQSDLAIWTLKMDPGAAFTLPPARAGTHRSLYVFAGDAVSIAGTKVNSGFGAELHVADAVQLQAGAAECELLLLQGRPIGEPVAQHGPFVMNTQAELRQAFFDYQRTQFGGWPWPKDGPVHARTQGRFAKHADGRREERDG